MTSPTNNPRGKGKERPFWLLLTVVVRVEEFSAEARRLGRELASLVVRMREPHSPEVKYLGQASIAQAARERQVGRRDLRGF